MNIDNLQKRLEIWKRILFMNIGASVILILQAVLIYQDTRSLMFGTSWYGVWFVVQLAAFLPGFVLLWGKHWMQIPLRERLNTIFGYFAIAWFTLLPIGLRVGRYESRSLNFVLLGCAIAIAISYWSLRRKSMETQEMFP
jgi:hypothetical protein